MPTRQIFRGSLTCQSPGGRSPETQGNPAGKPKGVRNRATLAAEALLDGEAEALTRKAVEMALAGDVMALKLCLERLSCRHARRGPCRSRCRPW